MSGMMRPTGDHLQARSDTPRAIADLARALEGEGPSVHVEQALDAAWDAMHGAAPVAQPRAERYWPGWVLPALGAVAALLIAAAWVVVSRAPGRGAPDPAQVGLEAAVPGGPFEPPPSSRPEAPRDASPSGVVGDRRVPSRPREPSPGRRVPNPRAPAVPVARPAQVAHRDDAPEPFVWLRGPDEIEPGLGVHLVRVQVPRLRWDSGTPRRELVDADVLMGNDGQARAVRVVRTGTQ